jgi:hypothetical protein
MLLAAPELSSLMTDELRLGVLFDAAFSRDSMFMNDTRLGLALCGVLGCCCFASLPSLEPSSPWPFGWIGGGA